MPTFSIPHNIATCAKCYIAIPDGEEVQKTALFGDTGELIAIKVILCAECNVEIEMEISKRIFIEACEAIEKAFTPNWNQRELCMGCGKSTPKENVHHEHFPVDTGLQIVSMELSLCPACSTNVPAAIIRRIQAEIEAQVGKNGPYSYS